MDMSTDTHRLTVRLSPATAPALRNLAEGLGILVSQPSPFLGQPSMNDFLDILAACYIADPGGTHLALKVLLGANGLLPAAPPAADPDA